jgi:heme-degrading monooxygenase HmoA
MGVKIISKRTITKEKEEELMPLIIQLRNLAKIQSGFEYEETWRHLDHPDEYLVVREWEEEDDWHKWHASEERNEIQEKIEVQLGKKTEYSPYGIIHRIGKKLG